MKKMTESHSERSNPTKTTHHSHHRRHRSSRYRKINKIWYQITKPFRRSKERVSGVRMNQQIAERRIMIIFTVATVLLICILVPLVTWIVEVVSQSSNL